MEGVERNKLNSELWQKTQNEVAFQQIPYTFLLWLVGLTDFSLGLTPYFCYVINMCNR